MVCVQVGSVDSEEIEVRMLVHQSHAGRIIGKGGDKVKKIRSVSVYIIKGDLFICLFICLSVADGRLN